MKKKPFNLREALSKQGAELDAKQIAFIDAFSTALDERSESDKEEMKEDLSVSIRTALTEALGEIPKDEKGNVETIASQIRTIAENLDKIEKRSLTKMNDTEKFQLRKMIEENKDKIVEAIRSGNPFELNFRAAAAHTDTNTIIGTSVALPEVENYLVDSDIAKIRYPDNFILSVIRNTQVAKVPQQIIKLEQSPVEGAVTVVAEGGLKPLLQFQFNRTTTERVKYAGHIEWSEEFEMDNERLFAEIIQLFEETVIRAWNDGIVDQIIANAIPYTTSVLDGTLVKPDNGIAAIASASVISALNFNPDTVIMHPSDVVATMFTQDTEGNWRLIPFLMNDRINGMRLIQSNAIEQGNALIGDSSVYREWHSAFILRFGYYNDQFVKNMKSAVGEVFSILQIADLNLNAWMYIDLDAVKDSLEVAP
jgi:hypothetical protein